jgi:hypothetical protein
MKSTGPPQSDAGGVFSSSSAMRRILNTVNEQPQKKNATSADSTGRVLGSAQKPDSEVQGF